MAAVWFLYGFFFFLNKTSKMKENAIALTDNHLSNYTKTIIIILRLRDPLDFVLGIIQQYALPLRRIIVK